MADFEIGATEMDLTNLEALGVPIEPPKSEYFPYARTVNKGNQGKRGVGSPVASWTFGILTVEQRDQLKEFCPNASGEVFIRTKLNDDTYEVFSATMLWVENEARWTGGYKQNYQIVFRGLVLIPGGS
jgi:hypothetical protein